MVRYAWIMLRFVDDTFAVFNNLRSVKEFEEILNSIHPNIKFTTEINANYNSLSFLHVLVNNILTKVIISTFRKPTDTDCLQNRAVPCLSVAR